MVPVMLSIDEVRSALDRHVVVDHPALPGRTNHLSAGVLLPLQWTSEGVEILLTRRPATMKQHPGEVSFPGGKPEPTDLDLEATALRETREELGVERLSVLGSLCSMPVFTSDFRLHPYVGVVHDTELRPEPAEVAEVVRFDVLEWVQPGRIEGIPYAFKEASGVSPVFRFGSAMVFGATAHSLVEFLEIVAPLLTGAPLPPPRVGGIDWADVTAWAEKSAAGG